MRAVAMASRPRLTSHLRGRALSVTHVASRAMSLSSSLDVDGKVDASCPSTVAAPEGPQSGQRVISESRLRQFLEAEVCFFAGQRPNSITLREVLDSSSAKKVARLSHQELPIRFAQRIHQIEEMPGWDTSQELKEVHSFYSKSFRDLRMVEIHGNDLVPFTEVVQKLKQRMRGVIPRLAGSMRLLQKTEDFSEEWINEWLDTFLLSRIGTEMLTSHYMACVQPSKGSGPRQGIVDVACDPVDICEQAAKHAKRLCRQHFKQAHDLRILVESPGDVGHGRKRIVFPYVPQYLFYIMVELLKNSARATVDSCKDPQEIKDKPIIITIGGDPSQVGIRVEDQAGGIPFAVADRVWSYMYTTANKTEGAVDFSQEGTPLAGYGVGLPLSRLYARYLGGSLHLMSVPNDGTSAYLYLRRLESEAREELPVRHSLSSVSSLDEDAYESLTKRPEKSRK